MSITTRLIPLEVPATPRTSSMYWASAWSLVPRRSREAVSRSCRKRVTTRRPAANALCPRTRGRSDRRPLAASASDTRIVGVLIDFNYSYTCPPAFAPCAADSVRAFGRPPPAGPPGCPRIVPPATRAPPRSHLLVAFRHTDDERHRGDPALSLSK